MNFLEIEIAKKMQEADPSLDVQGLDRRIVLMAASDFTNYLKMFWKLPVGINNAIVIEKAANSFQRDQDEADSFLSVWIGMWLKKWKQRVKLVLENQSLRAPATDSAAKPVDDYPPEVLERKEQMLEMIVSVLVRNAEICGSEILAEGVLKTELRKIKNFEGGNEQMFAVLNGALKRAREIAQNVGPLIFVKIDKGYYASAVQ